jgi:hypothetical protein
MPANSFRHRIPHISWLLAMPLAVAPWGCAGDPVASAEFAPPLDTSQSIRIGLLEVSPDPVDLGTLRAGRSARAAIALRNTTGRTIVVDRIESSCDCLSLPALPLEVRPGSRAEFPVVFDSSHEAGFAGELGILVRGFDSGNTLVFRTQVRCEVVEDCRPRRERKSYALRGSIGFGDSRDGTRRFQ